jgi:DNA invertase Pin-like site-specific DNA recombinase
MRAAIYTRVSTSDQNPDLQIREIQDYASRQGWEIVETYQDTISGAKASRPGLNRLMADARARKFTCLLVWKLDRFGRSLVDCLNNIGSWRNTESGLSQLPRPSIRTFRTLRRGSSCTFWERLRNSKGP